MRHLSVVLFLVSSHAFGLIGGQFANQWTVDSVLKAKSLPSLEAKIFPSQVLLAIGCTGNIVGKRHILTAAHCVVNELGNRSIRKEMKDGETLQFDTRVHWKIEEPFDKSWSHSMKIVKTLVHPSYMYAGLYDNFAENTGDVALIIVDKDIGVATPTLETLKAGLLPISKISYEAMDPDFENEAIIKLGYGCESLSSTDSQTNWRFKFDAEGILPDQTEALGKATTYPKALFKDVFSTFYWISKGFFYDDTKPATNCPGDSGGALYNKKNLEIVGLNSRSRYGKEEDETHKVMIDFHTRLDEESTVRIDRWLKRALEYPGKGWFQGIAFVPIVPQAVDFRRDRTINMKVRDDLFVKSKMWIGYLGGVNEECPLKFKTVEGKSDTATLAMKNSKDKPREFSFERPSAEEKFEVRELKLVFEEDDTIRDPANLCYISFYARE